MPRKRHKIWQALRLPSVPFPWFLAVHHQTLVSRSPLPCEKRSAWGGGWFRAVSVLKLVVTGSCHVFCFYHLKRNAVLYYWKFNCYLSVAILSWWFNRPFAGHVEKQTMQTAYCRLCALSVINFYYSFLLPLIIYVHCASPPYVHWCVPARVMGKKWENRGLMFTGRCKSSFACFSLRRFHAGANTMEEGKLFLSVTVLYCHDYLFF